MPGRSPEPPPVRPVAVRFLSPEHKISGRSIPEVQVFMGEFCDSMRRHNITFSDGVPITREIILNALVCYLRSLPISDQIRVMRAGCRGLFMDLCRAPEVLDGLVLASGDLPPALELSGPFEVPMPPPDDERPGEPGDPPKEPPISPGRRPRRPRS